MGEKGRGPIWKDLGGGRVNIIKAHCLKFAKN